MKDVWTFIANQPAEDFQPYAECLELVCRGLVAGKAEVMVERLRHLLDEPLTENSGVDTVETSCHQPAFMSAECNNHFYLAAR